ncbi:MAG: hypothetical protein GY851_18690 [bacterium]|nr:hypothetical protein [bacterium]
MHWFNPIAWWVLSRLRADRELVRDAWGLARIPGDARTDYGQLLLRLMEYRPRFGRFDPL